MEQVLDMAAGNGGAFVSRATDPVILPQPYASPADFTAQYPIPLDPTEFIAMCDEVNLVNNLTEERTALLAHTWRELNSLAFASGSTYISFADGECPEEYTHDGEATTVYLKNLGAKKSLSESEVMHSSAVAAANWHGINRLVGGSYLGQGLPGGGDAGSFLMESVADLKIKEIRLATTLVLNGLDRMLVTGNKTTNSLEFDGLETILTEANGAYYNSANASGTFSAQTFDRFLSAGCAKPTMLTGHPQALQEVASGYYSLGFNGSQLINFESGNRIVPGFNFANMINTAVGQVKVVSDKNFSITASGATQFQSNVFALREMHNGVPLVYRLTQIPLNVKDLAPGCTAVSFQVWTKTALIVKHKCAHARFITNFTGNVVTTCPVIG
jgi:hypothetical protein